jgi:hypothetical protein
VNGRQSGKQTDFEETTMPRDYTDVTVILDRSGSMSAIQDATILGFNDFVNSQKAVAGDGCWSLVQFDDQYEVVYAHRPQAEVPLLTPATFRPRGSTALIDAVCRTIDETAQRLARTPEWHRPSRVLIVVVTDGCENSSRQFNQHDLNERIAYQRDECSWQFVFLGANQDAIAEAAKYGIGRGCALNYQATAGGTRQAYGALDVGMRAWKVEGNDSAADFFTEPTKDAEPAP